MTREDALEKAIEIGKEAARSGNANPPYIIEQTYNKIVEIAEKDNMLA